MKVTVLMENTAPEGLFREWGLSILVEYEGAQYLLDTGASDRFIANARKLGKDMGQVDYGILSHAHFDHANGMAAFLEQNKNAVFLLREGAGENCYTKKILPVYIGIKKGITAKYKKRISFVGGDYALSKGVWLIPHKTPGLSASGKREGMYVRHGLRFTPDDFSHEQSAVFETEQGLVIVNGCCHGGVDNIIKEVQATFPGKHIYAIIGGFHLFRWSEGEVRALCDTLKTMEVDHIYTGHCTGKRAYAILKEQLGGKVELLTTGAVYQL